MALVKNANPAKSETNEDLERDRNNIINPTAITGIKVVLNLLINLYVIGIMISAQRSPIWL